jgi:hypothetical protein
MAVSSQALTAVFHILHSIEDLGKGLGDLIYLYLIDFFRKVKG